MARMRNLCTSTDYAKFAWRMYRFLASTRNDMTIDFSYRRENAGSNSN